MICTIWLQTRRAQANCGGVCRDCFGVRAAIEVDRVNMVRHRPIMDGRISPYQRSYADPDRCRIELNGRLERDMGGPGMIGEGICRRLRLLWAIVRGNLDECCAQRDQCG